MTQESDLDPVEVFAGTSWEAGMLVSLLADNDIEAYFNDEILGRVAPWVAEPGGVGAIKVIVAAKDYEQAMKVVKEFSKTLQ
ncbi:DUF2007-related protein [Paludibacter jiangxiensis]|uniref:Putative signal transducing protein n=1 Tax=Paludibacter jiangxiensis TaxID=681398 RepID=A0A161LFZ1_9BACT|nr:DUF2007-related protein [Paludibacter jiangxiensis]GAT64185.1 putative signal transducing protein [Paludibacter jiangxiensis]